MSHLLDAVIAFFQRDWVLVAMDVADMLLVAYVLYRAMLLLKGTRAMQMGLGMGLVFVVYQVSKNAGLITLYTMLESVLQYVVLIIIVVFQNDIRRALMRVGRRPFLRSQRTEQETHVIDEVIKATTLLAQKRVGALVVFERDAVLDEFVDDGTVLDAAVSKELLHSIFIPSFENPMHDGAVIVREGRVWKAGAFLPLSASPKLDKAIGTRHRAAIGITEETDAVVVVVSEERGQVSLCFAGNMVRNLDSVSLREALLGLFYKKVPKSAAKSPAKESTGRITLPPESKGESTARTTRPSGPKLDPSGDPEKERV